MRKSIFVLVLLALALMAITAVTTAQEGADAPPSYCTDGTWVCDDPIDPQREAWNWECGWYWGHFDAGLIDEVPGWCDIEVIETIIPVEAPVVPPTPPAYPAGYCQVDLAAEGYTSIGGIHTTGYDIWDPGSFVEWIALNPSLPDCGY